MQRIQLRTASQVVATARKRCHENAVFASSAARSPLSSPGSGQHKLALPHGDPVAGELILAIHGGDTCCYSERTWIWCRTMPWARRSTLAAARDPPRQRHLRERTWRFSQPVRLMRSVRWALDLEFAGRPKPGASVTHRGIDGRSSCLVARERRNLPWASESWLKIPKGGRTCEQGFGGQGRMRNSAAG